MKRSWLLIPLILLLLILNSSYYILDEMHQTVVLQFGKVVGVETDPGLKLKLPLIQTVVVIEKRILAWDGEPGEMTTGDKKRVWVDTSARWYVENPRKFLESVTNEEQAQGRLDDVIDAEVRKAIAGHRVIDLVRGSNRLLTWLNEEEDLKAELESHAGLALEQGGISIFTPGLYEEELTGSEYVEETTDKPAPAKPEDAPAPRSKRREIMEKVSNAVDQIALKEFGIRVLDVRIKRLNYAPSVQERIYEKMSSERKAISEKYRSIGLGLADKIRGDKEKKLKEILSGAQRKAELIRGDGDATAARIYANAYNADPEFYVMTKTLETYRKAVDEETELILPLDSDAYRLMTEAP